MKTRSHFYEGKIHFSVFSAKFFLKSKNRYVVKILFSFCQQCINRTLFCGPSQQWRLKRKYKRWDVGKRLWPWRATLILTIIKLTFLFSSRGCRTHLNERKLIYGTGCQVGSRKVFAMQEANSTEAGVQAQKEKSQLIPKKSPMQQQ